MSIDMPAHSPDPVREAEHRANIAKQKIAAFDAQTAALKERFSSLADKIDAAKTQFETQKANPYSGFYAPEV